MQSEKVVPMRRNPSRITKTKMDTLMVTPDQVREWVVPPFQRTLKITPKVLDCAEQIKEDGGVIPGIITLGVLAGDKDATRYLLDGQHRREAFILSDCREGFVDVREHVFETMADMGEEFVQLNSHLVSMKPDDVLRGLEPSNVVLKEIRSRCPFVGYEQVRRGKEGGALLSMSMVLRVWFASSFDVPATSGTSVRDIASTMSIDEARLGVDFLNITHKAWSADVQNYRLWSQLNLALCAWIYRRSVLGDHQSSGSRATRITKDMFCKCLMSLSADSTYADWLVGRTLCDRDRPPAYVRIKNVFARRIEQETSNKPKFPAPEWTKGS